MKKIIALTCITFDGVMQAPGGPQEDPEITPGGVIVASYARAGEVKTALVGT
jgi:hypothetical protein